MDDTLNILVREMSILRMLFSECITEVSIQNI
jgi:hypothetical protein